MKCKVCGYEFDDSRSNCPMCGTPVLNTEGAPVEMKWNTKDFPKPRQEVADIRMQWSNPEVSEGYISVPDKPKRQFSANNEVSRPYVQPESEPVTPPVYTEPKAQPAYPEAGARPAYPEAVARPVYNEAAAQPAYPEQSARPLYTDPDAQRVPRVEDGRLPEKFYTFQTKNEEFQRLLDKEFERLKELQSQLPESKSFPLPGAQPVVEAAPMDDFDKMLMQDTADEQSVPAAENLKDAEPAAPVHSAEEPFDIQTLEQSIQLIRQEEEKAQQESEARLRKLEAMKAARDAYFKSLDEAEARKPLRGLFWREKEPAKQEPEKPAAPAAQEPKVSAEPEKPAVSEPKPSAEPEKKVPVFVQPALEDLTGSLNEDAEHTVQFVREDFIAAQDALLREIAASGVTPRQEKPAPAENIPAERPAPAAEIAPAEAQPEVQEPTQPEKMPVFAAEQPATPEPARMAEQPATPEEKPSAAESLQDTVMLRYANDLMSELEKIYSGSMPAPDTMKAGAAAFEAAHAEPEEAAAEPESQPAEPEEAAAEPEPQPAEPEEAAAEPEPQPAEPEEIAAEPEQQPAEPEEIASEPEPQPGEPEEIASEPEPQPAEPEETAAEPEPQPAEPEEAAAEPEPQPAEPEEIAAEPEPQPAEPEEVRTVPAPIPAEPEEAPEEVLQLVEEKEVNPLATQRFEGLSDEVGDHAEEDAAFEELPEEGGRHGFLKFLGLVILFLVLVQLIVLGLEKFLPDAGFTQTLVQITSSIQEACDEFFANAAETVKGWFQ